GRRGGPSMTVSPHGSFLLELDRALRGRQVADRIRRVDGDLRLDLLALVERLTGLLARLLRQLQLQGRRLTRPQIGARRLELVLLDLRQLPLSACGARLVTARVDLHGVAELLLLLPRELEVRRDALDGVPAGA